MPDIRSKGEAGDRACRAWRHSLLAIVVVAGCANQVLWAQQVPLPPLPAQERPPVTQLPPLPQPPPVAPPPDSQPPTVAPRQDAQALSAVRPFSDESEIISKLPQLPMAPPRPASGPRSAEAFVEPLHGNDEAITLIVNEARILTLKQDITTGAGQSLIAVGDPTILDFIVVNSRQIRIIGRGMGVTDLAITTAGRETYNFEIRVLADLAMIHAKLRATFPDASVKLSQIREHFVVEGEARDPFQVARIIDMIKVYLNSVFVQQGRTVTVAQSAQLVKALGGGGMGAVGAGAAAGGGAGGAGLALPGQAGAQGGLVLPAQPGGDGQANPLAAYGAANELGGPTQVSDRGAYPQVINLLRVVGSQQVMLKVRIAELNRTAMRRIGANFLGVDPRTGAIVGSSIAGATGYEGVIGQAGSLVAGKSLNGSSALGPNGANSTVFGIFQDANFEFSLTALRQNGLLKILAEPNLVALNGQLASFLAGGEFPVPVPQVSASGVAPHDHRPIP